MAALREPTVFTNEWKCGDTLKPKSHAGKYVDNVQACKVDGAARIPSPGNAGRNQNYKFFEKRDGFDCDRLVNLHKRQMDGHGHMPAAVPEFNTITPVPGKQAYARIAVGVYNEMFFDQADKSGLMTAGAQHNVIVLTVVLYALLTCPGCQRPRWLDAGRRAQSVREPNRNAG
jgi:hypothetical protein